MVDDSDKSGLARRTQMRRVERSLNKTQSQDKKQQKDYGEVLIEHLRNNGQIICISDDQVFIDLLRDLVTGTLKMPASCLQVTARGDMAGKLARQAVEGKKAPLVLIEQNLNGTDQVFAVRLLKNAFPELKLMMLAKEADKNRLVLLHESGVDDCIIKPLDSPALLEKLALGIRPPDQLERALDWAKNLLNQGEHLRALQICTQALEQQVNSSACLLLMGDIFKAMKEYDKAADAYTRASGSSSIYFEPLKKMADLYAETGNTAKQIQFLEKMDEISPMNLDRKIQIGELALKLNQRDKARKLFDQAMKLSNRQARENISSVAYRVADLYTASDPDMAASFLQRGLEARREFWGHEDLSTFNRLGLLLRRAGKWREAAEEYRKAITVAPNDESLHYNLAMAYLEGKDYEAARASTLKALGLNPDLPRRSSRVASNLATVFLNTNDKMHALPLLRTALELDPQNAQAREMMSRMDSAE